MWKICRDTPAKINLYLKVTKRRDDGYHELKSLFLPLAKPGDRITVSSSTNGLSLSSDLAGLPCDSRNTCYRAAMAYASAAGLEPDWHIHIEKTIPAAAGMGGGSSDAAAVLNILQQQYAALSAEQLQAAALKTGADVPFFLSPAPSVVTGIGEHIQPIDLGGNALPLLLVAPEFPVSAAWAYHNLDSARISPDDDSQFNLLLEALRKADWHTCGKLIYNDLGFAVFDKFPLLQVLRNELLQCGACGVEVSGSGPVLFAVFDTDAAANTAAETLRSSFPEVKIILPTVHFA